MIKIGKKEYKYKNINIDTRFDILTRAIEDGDPIKPNTCLWITKQTIEIDENELDYLSAQEVATIGNKIVVKLLEGKKK